jgi:Uma2 family endonuclease
MLTTVSSPTISLEDFMANPPDRVEWVDGQLLQKPDMNAKTGRIQARLAFYWTGYFLSQQQGGEVYTETPCRTTNRTRCPDVAYLTPDLVAAHGDFKILPHSFPLVAEIVSPTDEAEEVFTKVREYLASDCQEIWLIFPNSQWVFVITPQQQKLFNLTDTVSTQTVLPGFQVLVSDLIA